MVDIIANMFHQKLESYSLEEAVELLVELDEKELAKNCLLNIHIQMIYAMKQRCISV